MTTAFISYGEPDRDFAERLHQSLLKADLDVFLFKNDAKAGVKLHQLMRDEINSRDYTILICSKESLSRFGVINEIEECLQKEARQGGKTSLIPIAIDRFVFDEWKPDYAGHSQAVKDRVIADFVSAPPGSAAFNKAVERLIDSIETDDRFLPTTEPIGGKYIVHLEDERGHKARLIYTRRFISLVDDLDFFELPDLAGSGQIEIVGCNIGTVKEEINEGGTRRIIFEPSIRIEKGVEYEMIVEMLGTNCYLDETETASFFARYTYPYLEIEVFLPTGRPAKRARLIKMDGPRRTTLPHEVMDSNVRLFAHIDSPKIASTYVLEWTW